MCLESNYFSICVRILIIISANIPIGCPHRDCTQLCLHRELQDLLPIDLKNRIDLIQNKRDANFSECPYCSAPNKQGIYSHFFK